MDESATQTRHPSNRRKRDLYPKLKIKSFCIREKTFLACTRGDVVADSTTKHCTYTLQDSAAVRKLQRAPRILLGSSIGVEDEKVCPT